MYKLFKWIYKLGVQHERRRIKLLLQEHRQQKPSLEDEPLNDLDKDQLRHKYEYDLAVWYSVQNEIGKVIHPQPTIETKYHSELDEDI